MKSAGWCGRLVIPAEAGIQGVELPAWRPPVQARGKPWAPAFAGVTVTGC